MKILDIFFGMAFLLSVDGVAMELEKIGPYEVEIYLDQWLQNMGKITQELASNDDKTNQDGFIKYNLLIKSTSVCKKICQELFARNHQAEVQDVISNIEESRTQLIEARSLAIKKQSTTKRLANTLMARASDDTELKSMLEQMKAVEKKFSNKKSQEKL